MKIVLVTCVVTIALTCGASADVGIKMSNGSQCWSYQGLDTRYYGVFSGGQDITVAVVQQFENDSGNIRAVASNGDQVWVNGPDGYLKQGSYEPNDKERIITTDRPGRYIFNLYEHGARADYPVYVRICAAKK
jgi:hypothetical protein